MKKVSYWRTRILPLMTTDRQIIIKDPRCSIISQINFMRVLIIGILTEKDQKIVFLHIPSFLLYKIITYDKLHYAN